MIKRIVFQKVIVLIILILPTLVLAKPGDLDPTFGGKDVDGNGSVDPPGIVTTAINTTGSGYHYLSDMVIQPDGKIVVSGYNNGYFTLSRYNIDGTYDTTFGGIDGDNNGIVDVAGVVTTNIGSGTDYAYALALQSDGKIVAVGKGLNGSNEDFAVVRYNPDGSLDTSFDSDGIVTTELGSGSDIAYAVAIDTDGKIVVAGETYNGINADFAVARYNSSGILDTTFDGDGIVTTDFGVDGDVAYSIAIQTDGKILVVGNTIGNGTYTDFALARYNNDGNLDNTFGTGGVVTTQVGPLHDHARSVTLQNDGKILVTGRAYIGSNRGYDIIVARYNTSGVLDPDFGIGGLVATDVNSKGIASYNDSASDIALQDDGKIIVVGYAFTGSDEELAVVRYNTSGLPDDSFGGYTRENDPTFDFREGVVLTELYSGYEGFSSVAVQSDGKIVAAGDSHWGDTDVFVLARYNSLPDYVAAPQKIFVPTGTNTTGNLQVSWFDSATPGVDYLVECQLSPDGIDWTFQDWYGCATTPNTYYNFYNLASGFHHRFRVKAYKADYHDSTYVTSSPVLVEYRVSSPGRIYLDPNPTTTGNVQVSWGKSLTIGANYILEYSYSSDGLNWTPLAPVPDYADPTKTYANISGLSDGEYIFNVTATKSGYSDSSTVSSEILTVTVDSEAQAPRKIFVDTNYISAGKVQVSWFSSKTANATYVLEQSDNGGGTWGLVTNTAQTYANVLGLTSGSYLFRVKAVATGYTDSPWTTSASVSISTQAAAPRKIFVDSKKNSNLDEISWSKSSTPDATYVLDMSDDGGGTWFNYLPNVSGTSLRPTGVGTGTYIARVKAVKTGYADSDWVVSKSFDVQ